MSEKWSVQTSNLFACSMEVSDNNSGATKTNTAPILYYTMQAYWVRLFIDNFGVASRRGPQSVDLKLPVPSDGRI